jgi:hypothetical protein
MECEIQKNPAFTFPQFTFPTIYIIFTWSLQTGKRGVHFYCSLKMMTQTTSIKFRVVFWDILPCKMIVDRRFRGAWELEISHFNKIVWKSSPMWNQHNNQTNIWCVIIMMAVYRIKASWIHVFIKIMNYIWPNYNSVKVPGELLQHTHTLCFNAW